MYVLSNLQFACVLICDPCITTPTNTYDNYNNNNKHDNVYGAVIMAEPLREFTRFI